MRVTALQPDVLVFVSDVWQTTCTAVRAGEEGFVIDSPVYPEELRALPEVLTQAAFPATGLLTTHADWDHLLGRLAFPGASLGAGESTTERLAGEPGDAQRSLRDFDADHYVVRPQPLALGSVQSLPVPGKLELGPGNEIELFAAEGHTKDGTAYFLPWLRLLVCGDYLSPVEIPMISAGGGVDRYRATLERLAPLVARADWIVPGHGAPQSGEQAATILAEDLVYLSALGRAPDEAELPDGRRSDAQQRIHTENLERAVAA